MTDTLQEHADPELTKGEALIEMRDVGKTFGSGAHAVPGTNHIRTQAPSAMTPICTAVKVSAGSPWRAP